MARITPIDVIQGISGKYGNGSSDYFATNRSSHVIRLAKYKNKYTGPFTQQQLDQMQAFANQAKQANAWLRANRPDPAVKGDKGTAAYQEAQALKRQMHLSNVRQIVIKYMDAEGNVTLPATGLSPAVPGGTTGSGTNPNRQYTISVTSANTDQGTVSGGGTFSEGSHITVTATPKSGYTFDRWSDGVSTQSRQITVSQNLTLTASFKTATTTGEGGSTESGDGEEYI